MAAVSLTTTGDTSQMDKIDFNKSVFHPTATKDFTVFWENKADTVPEQLRKFFEESKGEEINLRKNRRSKRKSFNQQVVLASEDASDNFARSCVCRCWRGDYLSATFRSERIPSARRSSDANSVEWKCAPWGDFQEYAIETFNLIDAIFESIWPDGQPPHPAGLVVFAGATNSGKSQLAKAFSLETIRNSVNRAGESNSPIRLPHLVTFEDPIESWKLSTRQIPPNKDEKDEGVSLNPKTAANYGFCFTPREREIDVDSLSDALRDAKRQTPACFYIGEVREPEEWTEIIEFAGSGHLVVATTHAGRLPETIGRIVKATKAITPANRRDVGACITACIHLEPSAPNTKKIILPSLWIHRGAALASFVADGLSSITPNGDYVLSRSQFLESCFISKSDSDSNATNIRSAAVDSAVIQQAIVEAKFLDVKDLLQQ